MQKPSPWISRPKQERSRRTLQRLLDTAEAMLMEGTFDQATIPRIVERAGSSTGSFYGLFRNKNALFECLLDRYQDRMIETARTFVRDSGPTSESLAERSRRWISKLVRFCRRERGVMRARVLHHIANPDTVPSHRKKRTRIVIREIRDFFLPCLPEINRRDPERALDFALMVLDYTVAYRVLLEDPRDRYYGRLSDQRLIDELQSLFLAYLGSRGKHSRE